MNIRNKVSLFLFLCGLLLAILPLTGHRSFNVKPEALVSKVLDPNLSLTVDEVARLIVNEDSTIRLLDLRNPGEFIKSSIPGAVNVPYSLFISSDPDIYLNDKDKKIILYSEDDYSSNLALVYSMGFGYNNAYVMAGGLNEWTKTILESKFTGTKISARENAIYEIRARASRIFNEINSLPDSLKAERLKASRFSAKKLDGGCE